MPDRPSLLLPLMLCAAFPLRAITTPEIAASALSPDCVNYRVVGLCYWLYCTPLGCTVRTSVKVSHFRPDLVVSAYSNTGQNPWAEMSLLSPALPGAEGGGDTNPRAANQHSKVRFKNADAIGFPAGDVFHPVWLYLLAFIAAFSTVLSESTRYAGVAQRCAGNDIPGGADAGHAGSRSERRYVGQYLPARRSYQPDARL